MKWGISIPRPIYAPPDCPLRLNPFPAGQDLSSVLSSAYVLRQPLSANNMDPDQTAPREQSDQGS